MSHASEPLTPHLRVHRERGHLVLAFHGEIDIIAALEITPYLDAATGRPCARVVLDLRHVEFFDCSGLRLLYRARRRILARDGRLQLVCAHPPTLRILHATGLAGVLPPLTTLDEALERSEAVSEAISEAGSGAACGSA
ncbi:STAS domain-containing protein [Streptomyces sporangiiformans]|uniref:STAS domain-containing protein n=1 Tax=Streptomyces sporangiiformans TaxID=2315329 RepID=UPI001F09962E|nr:STAS domain-containing protein [Streptomyces sporangiiformans]